MAYSANGYNFPNKTLSRVKYDLEYDSSGDLYRFKGKPQEVIIEADDVASDVFFNSASDYDQVWFDSSALEYLYGDQIFFDVAQNKNLTVLSEALTGTCLETMKDFTNYSITSFTQGDIPPEDYIITGEETILD